MSRFFMKATRTWDQIKAAAKATAEAAEVWEAEAELNERAAAAARLEWEYRPEAIVLRARLEAECAAVQADLEARDYSIISRGCR